MRGRLRKRPREVADTGGTIGREVWAEIKLQEIIHPERTDQIQSEKNYIGEEKRVVEGLRKEQRKERGCDQRPKFRRRTRLQHTWTGMQL